MQVQPARHPAFFYLQYHLLLLLLQFNLTVCPLPFSCLQAGPVVRASKGKDAAFGFVEYADVVSREQHPHNSTPSCTPPGHLKPCGVLSIQSAESLPLFTTAVNQFF